MSRRESSGAALLARRWAALVVLCALVFGCGSLPANTRLDAGLRTTEPASSPATPIRWRAGADCAAPVGPLPRSRQEMADACRDHPQGNDFVAIAISGGGAKAATFGGETLFMLERLGLLRHADIISGVSGGSFAATLYAASCDVGDTACSTAPGRRRPDWAYADIMRRLSQGYMPLIAEFAARAAVPLLPTEISADRFASFIDQTYLSDGNGRAAGLTFGDLNPRRPHLFINSAIVSGHRFIVDDADTECGPEAPQQLGRPQRNYLRRRTADEFQHFSFTDFYFRRLCSDIRSYPLARAVAASAAFPALIGYAQLSIHARRRDSRGRIPELLLTDGGANDNQGLTEIYMVLAEIMAGQRRSDTIPGAAPIERFGARDRALYFVVNTSLTEATGVENTPERLPGLLLSLFGTASRVSTAFSTASTANYANRRRAYLAELQQLERWLVEREPRFRAADWRLWNHFRVLEIGLTVLDQYPFGGSEAYLHRSTGVADEGLVAPATASGGIPAFVPGADLTRNIEAGHRTTFEAFRDPALRENLGLGDIHPQCLFEKSKGTDASLLSLARLRPNQAICLRDAARWATALRAQELCANFRESEPATWPLNDLATFRNHCVNGRLTLDGASSRPPRLACNLVDASDDDAEAMQGYLDGLDDRLRRRIGAGEEVGLLPDRLCRVRNLPSR